MASLEPSKARMGGTEHKRDSIRGNGRGSLRRYGGLGRRDRSRARRQQKKMDVGKPKKGRVIWLGRN